MTLLTVDNLEVDVAGRPILRGVGFTLTRGETLGIIGRSGSGKSMTALALMRLLPQDGQARGRIVFDGTDLLSLDEAAMCGIRGRRIGVVFQEPQSALNPLMTIGAQVAEGIRQHADVTRREAASLAAETLARAGLDPARVSPDRFPHELSGGQRQRVAIAMTVAMRPDIIIADEPTTALDVTTQARILDLLRTILRDDGPALLLISHDLGVVATMADRIAVMDEGRIVETGPTRGFAGRAHAPQVRTLIAAATLSREIAAPVPPLPEHTPAEHPPLLAAEAVSRRFGLPRAHPLAWRQYRRAVDQVSLSVQAGESVALIGESGSGKTTLASLMLGLQTPDAGRIAYRGQDIAGAGRDVLRRMRADVQAVFQDPYSSLDPRRKAGWIIAEPLHLAGPIAADERDERVAEALREVGLSPDDANKYPHAFSGGQRQRIAMARALVTRPRLVVLDEAVSSLDVVAQARILDLLARLRADHGLAYLFITHDLRVAKAIARRVAVMHDGRIVEEGMTAEVLTDPQHPYTRALLASQPDFSAFAA
ncbi:dipeptide ABC transporter ATP-binding protein [Pseudochelatococcus contaminans]|uniref:Peptide/nickel transport system ATP-binding protein n=1 Tax=Pseudochelatococcus contaminans TaxID=1538103 RepID=A0A7W6EGB8_9HYPH|nr:peptide/nickel transport system ATP-binding protein [Pseudochelatococcus contaminans]